MKTPLFIFQRARAGIILVIFTALLVQDARCESPLKRTLGTIKERLSPSLNKSADGGDTSRNNQPVRTKATSRATPRRLSSTSYDAIGNPSANPVQAAVSQSSIIYNSPKQPTGSTSRQLLSTSYSPNGKASENIAPSVASQPTIILSSPQQSSNSVVLSASEQQQPALRDLPLDNTSPPPSSPSSSTVQDSKGDAQRQVSTSETPIKYAMPVAGHPGFVYPPGIAAELKSMLDVRGCAAGEKMRDPRTGGVFLVPDELHLVVSELTKR